MSGGFYPKLEEAAPREEGAKGEWEGRLSC